MAPLPPPRAEMHGAVAEVAAVLGIEGNRVRASELVADVLVRDRDAETALAEPPLHFGLDLSREIDFGEPHVSVLVALDVLELGELGRIELVDEALGQHGDAEVAPHRPPLDDRAFDDVADRGKRHERRGVFLGDSVSVAPAALPMPSARWPALRPIATTTYQRRVDLASSISFVPARRRRAARSESRTWARAAAAAGRCRSSSARARCGWRRSSAR